MSSLPGSRPQPSRGSSPPTRSGSPPRGDRSLPQPQRGPQLQHGLQPQPAPHLQRRPDDAGDGVDFISRLPDEMLREVLVRLRCARSAAQTSVLSRRWRDLWWQLRHLYLRFRDVAPSDLLNVLAQVPSSDLALLDISIPYDRRFYYGCGDACVASLLRTAASFAPLEFSFSANVAGSSVEVPNFHRAESISLELRNISRRYQLELDTASDFPMLERLSVSGCHFKFNDLISRCPRLRALRVRISNYPYEIRVHSSTLREFILIGHKLKKGIDIEAPVLETLSLSECFLVIFLQSFLERFPCLRTLRLHCSSNMMRPSVHPKMYSARMEEIVLDGVEIMWGIEIDAPALKILTVTTDCIKDAIYVVAPVLKTFTLKVNKMDWNIKMFVLVPALENLLWDFTFSRPASGIHWMWFLENLDLRIEEGVYKLFLLITLQHPGLDPPNFREMFALSNISFLRLKLYTHGHAYGATVTQILGICSEIQKLYLIIKGNQFGTLDKACGPKCSCRHPESWRDQDISLSALEAVEIEDFGGQCCEVDLLKLLFRRAPLMKQMIMKQSPDMLPSIRACNEICNLFKAHPYVKCYIYDSFGKKVVYERSVFASRRR